MASEHHHVFEIVATALDGSAPGPHYKISSDLDDSSWSPCIQGYKWRCVYCTDPAAGTVSFTICLLPHSITCNSLLDRGRRPVPARTRSTTFQNCVIPQTCQWDCLAFFTSDDLQRQEWYLSNDGRRFTIRCDITVVKPVTANAADDFVTVPPSDLHRHLSDLLAHRCVLAARSPVFRAQLLGEMMESKSTGVGVVIPIEDMEAQAFGSLLDFIYTDMLPPENAEQDGDHDEEMELYQHLLAATDRYGVERMKLVCEEKLCRHIRADSVAMLLVLADRHHCAGLKEACFCFLTSSANLESSTETTDGFQVLNASCPAVLKELLAKLATRYLVSLPPPPSLLGAAAGSVVSAACCLCFAAAAE